jgi:hypothetical protein
VLPGCQVSHVKVSVASGCRPAFTRVSASCCLLPTCCTLVQSLLQHILPGITVQRSGTALHNCLMLCYAVCLVLCCLSCCAVLRCASLSALQGQTKLALYGLGNVRDERLGRLFQTPGCVQW